MQWHQKELKNKEENAHIHIYIHYNSFNNNSIKFEYDFNVRVTVYLMGYFVYDFNIIRAHMVFSAWFWDHCILFEWVVYGNAHKTNLCIQYCSYLFPLWILDFEILGFKNKNKLNIHKN